MLRAYSHVTSTAVVNPSSGLSISGSDDDEQAQLRSSHRENNSLELDYEDIRVRRIQAPCLPTAQTYLDEGSDHLHYETASYYIIYSEDGAKLPKRRRAAITKQRLPFRQQAHWGFETERRVTPSFVLDHVIVSIKGLKYAYMRQIESGRTWLMKLPKASTIRSKVRHQYAKIERGEAGNSECLGFSFAVSDDMHWLLVYSQNELWVGYVTSRAHTSSKKEEVSVRWTSVKFPFVEATCASANFVPGNDHTTVAVVWLQHGKNDTRRIFWIMDVSIQQKGAPMYRVENSTIHSLGHSGVDCDGCHTALTEDVHLWSSYAVSKSCPFFIVTHMSSGVSMRLQTPETVSEDPCDGVYLHSKGTIAVAALRNGNTLMYSTTGLPIVLKTNLSEKLVSIASGVDLTAFNYDASFLVRLKAMYCDVESFVCAGASKGGEKYHQVTDTSSIVAMQQLLPESEHLWTIPSGCIYVEVVAKKNLGLGTTIGTSVQRPTILGMPCGTRNDVTALPDTACSRLIRSLSCIKIALNLPNSVFRSHDEGGALFRQQLRVIVGACARAMSHLVCSWAPHSIDRSHCCQLLQTEFRGLAYCFQECFKYLDYASKRVEGRVWLMRTFVKKLVGEMVESGLHLCSQCKYADEGSSWLVDVWSRIELAICVTIAFLRQAEMTTSYKLSQMREAPVSDYLLTACRDFAWNDVSLLVCPQSFLRDWIHLSVLIVKAADTCNRISGPNISKSLAALGLSIATSARRELGDWEQDSTQVSASALEKLKTGLQCFEGGRLQSAIEAFDQGGAVCYPYKLLCVLKDGGIRDGISIAKRALSDLYSAHTEALESPFNRLVHDACVLTCKITAQYILQCAHGQYLWMLQQLADQRDEKPMLSLDPGGILHCSIGSPLTMQDGIVLPHPHYVSQKLGLGTECPAFEIIKLPFSEDASLSRKASCLAAKLYYEADEYKLCSVIGCFLMFETPANRTLTALEWVDLATFLNVAQNLFRCHIRENRARVVLPRILEHTKKQFSPSVSWEIKRKLSEDLLLFNIEAQLRRSPLCCDESERHLSGPTMQYFTELLKRLTGSIIGVSNTDPSVSTFHAHLRRLHYLLEELGTFLDQDALFLENEAGICGSSAHISGQAGHGDIWTSIDNLNESVIDDLYSAFCVLLRDSGGEKKPDSLFTTSGNSEEDISNMRILLWVVEREHHAECSILLETIASVEHENPDMRINFFGAAHLFMQICHGFSHNSLHEYGRVISQMEAILSKSIKLLLRYIAWDIIGYLLNMQKFRAQLTKNSSQIVFSAKAPNQHLSTKIFSSILQMLDYCLMFNSESVFDMLVILGIYNGGDTLGSSNWLGRKAKQVFESVMEIFVSSFWDNVLLAIQRLVNCSKGLLSEDFASTFCECLQSAVQSVIDNNGDMKTLFEALNDGYNVYVSKVTSYKKTHQLIDPLLIRWLARSSYRSVGLAKTSGLDSPAKHSSTKIEERTSENKTDEETMPRVNFADLVHHDKQSEQGDIRSVDVEFDSDHNDGTEPYVNDDQRDDVVASGDRRDDELRTFGRRLKVITHITAAREETEIDFTLQEVSPPTSENTPADTKTHVIPSHSLSERFCRNQKQLSDLLTSNVRASLAVDQGGWKIPTVNRQNSLVCTRGPNDTIEARGPDDEIEADNEHAKKYISDEHDKTDTTKGKAVSPSLSGQWNQKNDDVTRYSHETDSFGKDLHNIADDNTELFTENKSDVDSFINLLRSNADSDKNGHSSSNVSDIKPLPWRHRKLLQLEKHPPLQPKKKIELKEAPSINYGFNEISQRQSIPQQQVYHLPGRRVNREKKSNALKKYLRGLAKAIEPQCQPVDLKSFSSSRRTLIQELESIRKMVRRCAQVKKGTENVPEKKDDVMHTPEHYSHLEADVTVEEVPFESSDEEDALSENESENKHSILDHEDVNTEDFFDQRFVGIHRSIKQLEDDLSDLELDKQNSQMLLKRLDDWSYHVVKESEYRGLRQSAQKCIDRISQNNRETFPGGSSHATESRTPLGGLSRKADEAETSVKEARELLRQCDQQMAKSSQPYKRKRSSRHSKLRSR